MELPLYQVDAFTREVFHGNPAAVCPLEAWPPDAQLQAIAAENNLSETAFFVADGDAYHLRWFTPTLEVDLCGHATLATAHVLYHHLGYRQAQIAFNTRSGRLDVKKEGDIYLMDFPARAGETLQPTPALLEGLNLIGTEIQAVRKSRDWMVVLENEAQVRAVQPDLARLKAVDTLGVIVTAPGEEVDFVSRFFAPGAGVDEDPVTGSAHCTLIPYWAEALGKDRLQARQLSARGGELFCEMAGERVKIAGRAVTYLEGKLRLS